MRAHVRLRQPPAAGVRRAAGCGVACERRCCLRGWLLEGRMRPWRLCDAAGACASMRVPAAVHTACTETKFTRKLPVCPHLHAHVHIMRTQ